MSRSYTLMAALSLFTMGGCSSGAQVVRRDNHGGELAVWGPVVGAAQHARHALVEHCGGRFVVGRGADALGLGKVDATIVPVGPRNVAPEGARVFAYRCNRVESSNGRAVAFVQGGLGR